MQRKAFLVHFPKKEVAHNSQQTYSPISFPDNRPTLFIAYNISEVAGGNKTAIKIEEVGVQDVFIIIPELLTSKWPFSERK